MQVPHAIHQQTQQEEEQREDEIMVAARMEEEHEKERERLSGVAMDSPNVLMDTIHNLEWCTSYEKSGVKGWVAPRHEHGKEFRVMGTTTIRRPPSTVFNFILDTKNRPAWDKLLNDHKIVDVFSDDENQRTMLWTMKFRPRYLKMKRRVTVFACYSGVNPFQPETGSYMISMASVNTPMVTLSEDEIPFAIPITGYIVTPVLNDPNSTVLTYALRIIIQNEHLGFMERAIVRSISQWAPPHLIIDRMSTIRSLIEERSTMSVLSTFSITRESNFPPQFLRDFAYIKKDPTESRDEVMKYYSSADSEELWTHVATERGLVMKRFSGPLLHERHNLALKLSFSTSNFIQFSRCLSDVEKRLIWEPCATKVEHIWDDGPMNVCLKVVGGGPAKGRGCPKFEVFVYHIYGYGLKGNSADPDLVDCCVYEEHSDGNILLVLLTAERPTSNIDVFFFTNTAQYSERSRTSLTFLPASPLAPIERTLLESVIEFRNVVELDTWLPSESIEKLSLNDITQSVIPQPDRGSIELPSLLSSTQKRKQTSVLTPEEINNAPLLGKVRSYFNKLPPFSSLFASHSQQPLPPSHVRANSPSLHLLFNTPPPNNQENLVNLMPYELLVHIFKFMDIDDIRPCAQVCHRAWQITNCDVVWRELMAHEAKRRMQISGWENYAPVPNFSTGDYRVGASTEGPLTDAQYRPFDAQVRIPLSVANSTASSRSSSTSSLQSLMNPKEDAMEVDETVVTTDQRREELKTLLDTIQGYASPYKLEYIQSKAVDKCWKYGVSNFIR